MKHCVECVYAQECAISRQICGAMQISRGRCRTTASIHPFTGVADCVSLYACGHTSVLSESPRVLSKPDAAACWLQGQARGNAPCIALGRRAPERASSQCFASNLGRDRAVRASMVARVCVSRIPGKPHAAAAGPRHHREPTMALERMDLVATVETKAGTVHYSASCASFCRAARSQ